MLTPTTLLVRKSYHFFPDLEVYGKTEKIGVFGVKVGGKCHFWVIFGCKVGGMGHFAFLRGICLIVGIYRGQSKTVVQINRGIHQSVFLLYIYRGDT